MTEFFNKALRWVTRLLVTALMIGIALTACSYWPAAYAAEEWTSRQTVAHEIAELARGIGLPEDNPIITECVRLWWSDAIVARNTAELTASGVLGSGEYIDTPEVPNAQETDSAGPESVTVIDTEVVGVPETHMTYLGEYQIVGYDDCFQCCGKTDGVGAAMVKCTVGRTVAAGKQFDFGTRLYIEGLGEFVVEDRGPSGNVLDVFCNNHDECKAITGTYQVWLVED